MLSSPAATERMTLWRLPKLTALIGMNMSSSSDIAQTTADVVVVRPHLGGILVLVDLSNATFHYICFNFVW